MQRKKNTIYSFAITRYLCIYNTSINDIKKNMRLDNLLTVFFIQPHVLKTIIEKETNPKKKKTKPICFGLEKNGKNLFSREKVK